MDDFVNGEGLWTELAGIRGCIGLYMRWRTGEENPGEEGGQDWVRHAKVQANGRVSRAHHIAVELAARGSGGHPDYRDAASIITVWDRWLPLISDQAIEEHERAEFRDLRRDVDVLVAAARAAMEVERSSSRSPNGDSTVEETASEREKDSTGVKSSQNLDDPISNAVLAKSAGYKSGDYMARQVRDALDKAGRASPKPRPGPGLSWSHAQLRAALEHLPAGSRLKKFLLSKGF